MTTREQFDDIIERVLQWTVQQFGTVATAAFVFAAVVLPLALTPEPWPRLALLVIGITTVIVSVQLAIEHIDRKKPKD